MGRKAGRQGSDKGCRGEVIAGKSLQVRENRAMGYIYIYRLLSKTEAQSPPVEGPGDKGVSTFWGELISIGRHVSFKGKEPDGLFR